MIIAEQRLAEQKKQVVGEQVVGGQVVGGQTDSCTEASRPSTGNTSPVSKSPNLPENICTDPPADSLDLGLGVRVMCTDPPADNLERERAQAAQRDVSLPSNDGTTCKDTAKDTAKDTSKDTPKSKDAEMVPCILFMDSLRLHNVSSVAKTLRIYLECEWAARKVSAPKAPAVCPANLPAPDKKEAKPNQLLDKQMSDAKGVDDTKGKAGSEDMDKKVDGHSVKTEHAALPTHTTHRMTRIALNNGNIKVRMCNMPQQGNGYDCGMYVGMYARKVIDIWPRTTREDVNKQKPLYGYLNERLFDQEFVDKERVVWLQRLGDIRQRYLEIKEHTRQRKQEERAEMLPTDAKKCAAEGDGKVANGHEDDADMVKESENEGEFVVADAPASAQKQLAAAATGGVCPTDGTAMAKAPKLEAAESVDGRVDKNIGHISASTDATVRMTAATSDDACEKSSSGSSVADEMDVEKHPTIFAADDAGYESSGSDDHHHHHHHQPPIHGWASSKKKTNDRQQQSACAKNDCKEGEAVSYANPNRMNDIKNNGNSTGDDDGDGDEADDILFGPSKAPRPYRTHRNTLEPYQRNQLNQPNQPASSGVSDAPVTPRKTGSPIKRTSPVRPNHPPSVASKAAHCPSSPWEGTLHDDVTKPPSRSTDSDNDCVNDDDDDDDGGDDDENHERDVTTIDRKEASAADQKESSNASASDGSRDADASGSTIYVVDNKQDVTNDENGRLVSRLRND
jgi:hypothetical protein